MTQLNRTVAGLSLIVGSLTANAEMTESVAPDVSLNQASGNDFDTYAFGTKQDYSLLPVVGGGLLLLAAGAAYVMNSKKFVYGDQSPVKEIPEFKKSPDSNENSSLMPKFTIPDSLKREFKFSDGPMYARPIPIPHSKRQYYK